MAKLPLRIDPQPDGTTCGPTCLQAVYRYHGDEVPLKRLIAEVPPLDDGGTLAVLLGCHALERGYAATLYTCNLHVFDPTWFRGGTDLRECLTRQMAVKDDPKLRTASLGYMEFLRLGGKLRYEAPTPALLRRYLKRGLPILVGLSATHLYGCAREINDTYDDILGESTGHFVVVWDYHPNERTVSVADPLANNPGFEEHYYTVDMERLIAAILLGIVTYDANLLILSPRHHRPEEP